MIPDVLTNSKSSPRSRCATTCRRSSRRGLRLGRRIDELSRRHRRVAPHGRADAGRILKGGKPADLPAIQASELTLTVNTKVAKALGISVPLSLLGRADEGIERHDLDRNSNFCM